MAKGNRQFKAWEKEVKVIPQMIKIYCHGNHKTKKRELCSECTKLKDYALFRLEKCPFKKNKQFCSFCKIHCYQNNYRMEIKKVMRYSGPRIFFTHPIYACKHVVQMIKYKRRSPND
jgi:hypothetical protein